jgi:hypothetical protein
MPNNIVLPEFKENEISTRVNNSTDRPVNAGYSAELSSLRISSPVPMW